LVELETINTLVQIVGVSAAAIATVVGVRSYIVSNKRAEEARKRELETRQAQLFMQILLVNQSKELADSWSKLYSMDLSNAKELVERGWIRGEAEMHELMQLTAVIGTHYDGIGLYAKKGLIDIDMVKELLSGDFIMMWEKLRPLMLEVRKVTPFTMDNFEWLYDKLKSMQGQSSAFIQQ